MDRRSWLVGAVAAGAVAAWLGAGAAGQVERVPNPFEREALLYPGPILPGAAYDPDCPTPEAVLGFGLGARAATHGEIEACFEAWDEWSNRATLVEFGETHEGRSLFYLVVSSPENIRRLDAIKANWARLADPRGGAPEAGLAERLPVVAWFGCSIHGDETSPADSALALGYHLAACTDQGVSDLLDDVVVVIDPMMNPDGRDRFLKQVREHRSASPSVDEQSLLHAGRWPWGRTNHYLFDLNRDWIFCAQPESRARVRALSEWWPLLFIDAHEMGALDTYLFSPSREPINPYLPARRVHWWGEFAKDQASAFDEHRWRYYTGEWNEEWYPGYSSTWAGFRGAVGILYEQAGWAEDAVRQENGALTTYAEAVHRNLVSMLANLGTLERNRPALIREFVEERRANVAADGPIPARTFVIVPDGNAARLRNFVELMSLQGVEMHAAERAFTTPEAYDRFGRKVEGREFPAGSILIGNRQPEGPLVTALLSFDPRMTEGFLESERREILRHGESRLYDITAWNIPMAHDLDAYEVPGALPGVALPLDRARLLPARSGIDRPEARAGWVLDGADDASLVAAARLMQRGVRVRVGTRPFEWDGKKFPRGSMVVARDDNRAIAADLAARVNAACTEVGVVAQGVHTGLGIGDENPDIGGGRFPLLATPRIAVVGDFPFNFYSYGETWFAIDQRLGVEAAYLSAATFDGADLRRYNVLVLPEAWGSFVEEHAEGLKAWVESGGTLIAFGSAAGQVAGAESELTSVRTMDDVLEKLSEHELAVLREWAGRTAEVDAAVVYSNTPVGSKVEYPWSPKAAEAEEAKKDGGAPAPAPAGDGAEGAEEEKKDEAGAEPPAVPDAEEMKRRDEWQSMFMPSGAMIAARVDDHHWLTGGLRDETPALVRSGAVLMAAEGAEAPIRLGAFEAAPEGAEHEELVGFVRLPRGEMLRMRMSGLLWPEAAERLANTAVVTRTALGSGQVILFADSPFYRGATMGTGRVLLNALVLGPGAGASAPIVPK